MITGSGEVIFWDDLENDGTSDRIITYDNNIGTAALTVDLYPSWKIIEWDFMVNSRLTVMNMSSLATMMAMEKGNGPDPRYPMIVYIFIAFGILEIPSRLLQTALLQR